jgi:transposase
LPQELDKVQARHPDKTIEVWFSDEARFGQQGTVTRIWALRGSRPRAVRQTKYEWLYVIGAVCPQTGRSSGLLSPYINAQVINIYLQQFSSEITEDVHAVLIWDQAGFHKSGILDVPENITIIHLPAYSPELNPVENLWHYFRGHYWSNRTYTGYDDLRLAAIEAWQKAALDPEIVKSVCRAKYAERNY